jgi:hypothetical protein
MNAINWRVPFASASFARLYSPAGHLTMSNDPSSATVATRRADSNRDGPPPFAAAHG